MGLDNGIILKSKVDEKDIPWFVELDNDYDDKTEVCYWRKCWGIRERIKNLLRADEDEYESKILSENIPEIVKILEKFMNPSYWDEYSDSIWDYEESIGFNGRNLKNLLWLKDYMDKHPEVECYFYDSY